MKNGNLRVWGGGVVGAVMFGATVAAAAAEVAVKEADGRVILSNEYVAVVVAPNGGMYVPEATDLATGKEILHGLKLNFPYFEHGIKTNQTAGYRIIRNPDGGVTVAMNMHVPVGLKRVAVRVRPADATDPARTWQTPLLPVEIKDKSDRYETTKAACDARNRVNYIELQEHSNHRGHPTAMWATSAAASLLKSDSRDLLALVSAANACYRIGEFTKATELADGCWASTPRTNMRFT